MSQIVKIALVFVAMMSLSMTTVSAGLLDTMVKYTLQVDDGGTFEVVAEVSDEDNMGLAGYGLPLTGDITSIDNVSPMASFGTITFNPLVITEEGSFGFDMFRDVLQMGDGTWVVRAVQTLTTNQPTAIFGIGQEAGDLNSQLAELQNLGHIDSGYQLLSSEGATYDQRLQLVSGTWDVTGARPEWNTANITDLSASVFRADAVQSSHFQNNIAKDEIEMAVPEPTSVALLAIGGLLMAPYRRRQAD